MNAVLFQVKNENTSDSLPIQGINITVKELREKIKEKLSIQSDKEELQLFDEHDRALSLSDKVRQTQKVIVQRLPKQSSRQYCRSCFFQKISTSTPCCRQPICLACDQRFTQISKCPFTLNTHCQFNYVNFSHQPIIPKPEISAQDLQQLINNAAFFVVKSNNETNVHIAKSHNVWATTHRNKKKLQNAFNQFRTVILIFTANRCERFLGCAKMVNIYVNAPFVKWQGTGNVVLDDNFGIEWLRRGCLDFSRVGDRVNQITGEPISKSRDCQEIFSDMGKQLCLEFEIKTEENSYITNQPEPMQQEQAVVQQYTFPQQQQQIVENSPKNKPIEQPPQQQQFTNHDDDEVQWDYDAILQFLDNPTKVEKQPSQNKEQIKEIPNNQPSVVPPIQSTQHTIESKHDSDSESDSESSEANPVPDTNAIAQQQQIQMMMLQNPAYFQLFLQQQQQQQYKHQVDTWNTLNRGKIPGLTGKIKYQHPYFQQMAQQQALQQHQAIEMMKQMNQKEQSKDQGYDSRSEESKRRHRKEKRSKSKRSKSNSKDRRSKRKSHDKDRKQKSHKDKSRSRSHDRHKKHRKH